MSATDIQYLDSSWNPITGCLPGLPCWDRCWARRMAKRLAGRCGYDASDPFRLTFHPDRLADPLKWRKPRRIGVSFMGDIGLAPDEWLKKVLAVMSMCGQHTFFVLTKRPNQMATFFERVNLSECQATLVASKDWWQARPDMTNKGRSRIRDASCINGTHGKSVGDGNYWPLPNVLIGTSVENQKAADVRIPALLRCPGRLWLSVEPLIEKVELHTWPSSIEWVAVGPETGPGRRPCDSEWVRGIIDQTKAAGAPVFVKAIDRGDKVIAVPELFPGWANLRELPAMRD